MQPVSTKVIFANRLKPKLRLAALDNLRILHQPLSFSLLQIQRGSLARRCPSQVDIVKEYGASIFFLQHAGLFDPSSVFLKWALTNMIEFYFWN